MKVKELKSVERYDIGQRHPVRFLEGLLMSYPKASLFSCGQAYRLSRGSFVLDFR